MSSPSSDPQPEETPGLEEGGGVRPGDTPPSEAGMSGLSAPEPKEPSRGVNKGIAITIAVLAVLLVLFFLVRGILLA